MHHAFCTFLCRRCTTTTWKCLISRFHANFKQHHTTRCFAQVWSKTTFQSFPHVFDLRSQFTTFFFFSWTLIQSFRVQLPKKNCQHLTNLTRWNKRDKVWGSANSLVKWRFRNCRRRCHLKSSSRKKSSIRKLPNIKRCALVNQGHFGGKLGSRYHSTTCSSHGSKLSIAYQILEVLSFCAPDPGGGGVVLPFISYIGMCRPIG